MTRTSSRLTFLVLCVSIMGWYLSKTSAQAVPPLPPGCSPARLANPVRCGCFGYENELEDPKWSLLRQECADSLGGDIDNGRSFCNSTFIDNNVIQRKELFSFFNYTLFNCAARVYDIDITDDGPYPTADPTYARRFIEISHGHRRTNHEQYFGGYADVPSYQTASMRMGISTSARYKVKNFCLTLSVYRDFKGPRAQRVCCQDHRRRN